MDCSGDAVLLIKKKLEDKISARGEGESHCVYFKGWEQVLGGTSHRNVYDLDGQPAGESRKR